MFTAIGSVIAFLFTLVLRGVSVAYRDRQFYIDKGQKWTRNLAIFYGVLFLGLFISFLTENGTGVSIFALAISLTFLGWFMLMNASKRVFFKEENFLPAYGLGLIGMIFAFIPIVWYTLNSAFAGFVGVILFLSVCLIIIWWIWGGMTQVDPLQVPRGILVISTILVLVYGASIIVPNAFPTQNRVVVGWLDWADTRQNVYAAGIEEAGRFVTTRPIKPMPLFSRTAETKDGKEVVQWEYLKVSDASGILVDWVIPTTQEIKARNPKIPLFSAEGEQMFEVQLPDKYGLYAKSTETHYAPCRFTTICSNSSVGEKEKSDHRNEEQSQVISSTSGIVVEARKNAKHTGVHVKAGDVVVLSVSGSVVWDPMLDSVGYTGTSYPCSTRQQPSDFPLPSVGCGALVVEIGGNKYPATGPITIKNGGEIILDVNDRYKARPDNSGAYKVNLEVRR